MYCMYDTSVYVCVCVCFLWYARLTMMMQIEIQVEVNQNNCQSENNIMYNRGQVKQQQLNIQRK